MGNFSPLSLPKCILHHLEAAGYLTARSSVVAGKCRKNYRITVSSWKLLRDARGKLRELVSELLDRAVAPLPRFPRSGKIRAGHLRSAEEQVSWGGLPTCRWVRVFRLNRQVGKPAPRQTCGRYFSADPYQKLEGLPRGG